VTRVLVVYCHPNPRSFTASVRDRALAALAMLGHEVRLTDLYADGFQPAMSCDERRTHKEPGVAPELQRYADDLQWAQALVLVYPTWWSGQPAMLKGWIDRVWVAGVAWELPAGANVVRAKLRNIRRIVVVTGHGSSKFVNALEGEAGKRTVTRSMRAMCSRRARTTWCAIYDLDTAGEDARERFLAKVERAMSRL
jgi:NAD(P)H dehydrogenase (quinone)